MVDGTTKEVPTNFEAWNYLNICVRNRESTAEQEEVWLENAEMMTCPHYLYIAKTWILICVRYRTLKTQKAAPELNIVALNRGR